MENAEEVAARKQSLIDMFGGRPSVGLPTLSDCLQLAHVHTRKPKSLSATPLTPAEATLHLSVLGPSYLPLAGTWPRVARL